MVRLVIDEDKALERLLRAVEVLFSAHPQFSSVLVRALVEEGRAFGARPEGRRLMRGLAASPWVERSRILWEACGLDSLLGEIPGEAKSPLPSTWIRRIREDLAHAKLEPTLSALMRQRNASPNEHTA